MYINIGSDMVLRDKSIIGIFDLDNTTWSRHTRNFLNEAQKEGQIIEVFEDLPKAFILTEEFGMERVYLTQYNSATIERRIMEQNR